MKVGLIGLGNLGTAVGNLIAQNGHEVLGWEYQQAVVDEINQTHRNGRFLADVPLHLQLRATHELTAVFQQSEVVFIAIPSTFIESTLLPVKNAHWPGNRAGEHG